MSQCRVFLSPRLYIPILLYTVILFFRFFTVCACACFCFFNKKVTHVKKSVKYKGDICVKKGLHKRKRAFCFYIRPNLRAPDTVGAISQRFGTERTLQISFFVMVVLAIWEGAFRSIYLYVFFLLFFFCNSPTSTLSFLSASTRVSFFSFSFSFSCFDSLRAEVDAGEVSANVHHGRL